MQTALAFAFRANGVNVVRYNPLSERPECVERPPAKETMLMQAFLTQSTIERFDQRIVGRLPATAEVQLHTVKVRPPIE